ncbi:putative cytosol aminopeptidase [Candidatus Xenohaliotis californiensis]|uniref:Probable cytosol aminopeptidase n=1 Tax=Candidatus Xenohaliotis californiensis TaxID=84677 RepID=A0ABM9N8L5_9RICK|nr:putative cytosol aminopeptidase [Candidatus Xenohaliotis californiensis]
MKINFINAQGLKSQHVVYIANSTLQDVFKPNDDLVYRMVNAALSANSEQCNHIYFPDNASDIKEAVVLNAGEKLDALRCQNAGASVVSAVKNFNNSVKIIDVVVSINDVNGLSDFEVVANVAYGLKLASYRFDKYKSVSKNDGCKLNNLKVNFIVSDVVAANNTFSFYDSVALGVFLTRDLISEPANNLTPSVYLQVIKHELEPLGVNVSVLDHKAMLKMGMGALLGVSQGSTNEPFVVTMQWNGSKNKKDKPIAFVGKGVTFDSGGLSLKPSRSMEEMKTDMGGSAVVVGLLKSLAFRKANVNAVGVVGLVENMPSGSAQRPGDVVKSLSGQTIEVLNTDAEGRLVLADVLWYTANKFTPEIMIDIATLTGAAVIALGVGYAALLSNNDRLASRIEKSAECTGELVWRLPLPASYDKHIDSKIADVRNTSSVLGAGTITAAKFLQRFVKDMDWAHIDIASVAWNNSSKKKISPDGADGFGVGLLNNFVYENYEI